MPRFAQPQGAFDLIGRSESLDLSTELERWNLDFREGIDCLPFRVAPGSSLVKLVSLQNWLCQG